MEHESNNPDGEGRFTAGQSGEQADPFPADPWDLEPGPVSSIGDYLAKQRRLRGISREDLCTLTRIPLRSLERLESGAFDTLDDGFVRGFVRTVADALGLDPDDTLARMTQEPRPEGETPRSLATTGMLRVGVLLLGLALVLVSVGLVRTALLAIPGDDEPSQVVMRRDPVRALAQSQGVSVLDTTEALVPAPSRPDPGDAIAPGLSEPRDGAVVRADTQPAATPVTEP
ncbi:MAG: helix-turn-helix domain-containing protein [bacterium]|nr:helix-turn-helix domain-containing protein [bacterium]